MLGLTINTLTPAVYPTTLTDTEVNKLKTRLDAFNFDAHRAEQYAEIEEIMNKLNGTLSAEADQMDLGSLFSVMEKIREGKSRVSKPYEFVNVLLKIVGHIKGQNGGMNKPQYRTPFQPVRQQRQPLHGLMSPVEALQKQQVFKQNLLAKTRKIKATNRANLNENYGEVYPVTNAFAIPVGNTNNATRTRASSAANMYNLFNRPRHKAMWNSVFTNTKKRGGTRTKGFPKSNTPKFRKNMINYFMSRRNITDVDKRFLIERYKETARAGLATPNEIYALLTLSSMKQPEKFTNIDKLASKKRHTRRQK